MMNFTKLPETFRAERLERPWEFKLSNGHVERGQPGDWAIYTMDGHILFFYPDSEFRKYYAPSDDEAWSYFTGQALSGDSCNECTHDMAAHDIAGKCEIALCGCSV